jgi:hypothetical protein
VVSRPGKGQLPWYLFTNEVIQREEDIWHIVYSDSRRWQIEMTWRYTKSELGFDSPRLWSWEACVKLLMIATLAFAFLLSLLHPPYEAVREHLLQAGVLGRGSGIVSLTFRSLDSGRFYVSSGPFILPWLGFSLFRDDSCTGVSMELGNEPWAFPRRCILGNTYSYANKLCLNVSLISTPMFNGTSTPNKARITVP